MPTTRGASNADSWRMTLVFYRKRAFENECACTMLWRAFDKTVRRKPLAGAADAGMLWEFNRFLPEKPCQTVSLAKRLLLMLTDV